jgi:hypothetical protein
MSVKELIEELTKLQIAQTAVLTRLVQSLESLEPNANTTGTTAGEVNDPDRPLEIGNKVTVLNTGRFRLRRDTVCTVIRIGERVTVQMPAGTKIVRAAHNLRRVNVGPQ